MIQLREFEQIVVEFATKHSIDLTESSLFEQVVSVVAESLVENNYRLSKATTLFVDLIKDLDKEMLHTLHRSSTLRRAYKELA